jgi:hypothetical protein
MIEWSRLCISLTKTENSWIQTRPASLRSRIFECRQVIRIRDGLIRAMRLQPELLVLHSYFRDVRA